MQDLTLHLDYLLQYHDCVVIPGLGAVLAHTEAPTFDTSTDRWSAPRRVFSFNADLKRSDGLIATSVARRCGISAEAASQRVRCDVEALISCLEQGGRGSLGAAGALSRTSTGSLIFEPGNAAWLTPGLMWLPSFEMAQLQSGISEQQRLAAEMRRRTTFGSIARQVGRAAACIAILLGLGWVVVQNLADVGGQQFASLIPNPTENIASAPKVAESTAPVVLIMAKAPANENVENILPEADVISAKPNAGYYLIVASLANRSEAEKFVSAYEGKVQLGILETDGRYRVYAASGDNATDVMQQGRKAEIAAVFPDSWVCKR